MTSPDSVPPAVATNPARDPARDPALDPALDAARDAAMDKGRIEAFSDGVIAVAITLLILDLRVPEPDASAGGLELGARLAELWPNYLAYVASFLAIGIMWINHHAMLRRLKAVDHAVLVLNLVLLLFFVLLPFSTSLLATYLDAPSGGHLAGIIYAASFLAASLVFASMQALVLAKPHLHHRTIGERERRRVMWRGRLSLFVYVVAMFAALISPYVTLGLCVALGIYYLLPQPQPDRAATH